MKVLILPALLALFSIHLFMFPSKALSFKVSILLCVRVTQRGKDILLTSFLERLSETILKTFGLRKMVNFLVLALDPLVKLLSIKSLVVQLKKEDSFGFSVAEWPGDNAWPSIYCTHRLVKRQVSLEAERLACHSPLRPLDGE